MDGYIHGVVPVAKDELVFADVYVRFWEGDLAPWAQRMKWQLVRKSAGPPVDGWPREAVELLACGPTREIMVDQARLRGFIGKVVL